MSHKPTIGRRWKIISLTAAVTLTLAIPTLAFAVQNIFIASDQVTDVQVGSTPVNQIFIGNQLVWERNTDPPEGSNPPNVISTNPAVLDIYPTTGWTGDTIAITGNAIFTNVTNVTVGGTACSDYNVVSTSLITCRLPAKTSGTANQVAVFNNGISLFSAATYTNMNVAYFNPNLSTVAIGSNTFGYYPNGFTAANCAAMPATNTVGTTAPASIAYFRDPRNGQTYRVKKMADGKCWMIDNLKYVDTNVANTSDGTTGMTYNQGDHRGNGAITAFNTVDESATQSSINSDKAFYNNPMHIAYCYAASANVPANSLTKCGYLYNWYAATAGTGTFAFGTNGTQATGSICPANFRLPSVMSNGTTATSDGISYNAADFSVLNASMNSGTPTIGNIANYFAGWRPIGAWEGIYSGSRTGSWDNQSAFGSYWSSTAIGTTAAYNLRINAGTVSTNMSLGKITGFAVRCLIAP